jgi:hypothetical protein
MKVIVNRFLRRSGDGDVVVFVTVEDSFVGRCRSRVTALGHDGSFGALKQDRRTIAAERSGTLVIALQYSAGRNVDVGCKDAAVPLRRESEFG